MKKICNTVLTISGILGLPNFFISIKPQLIAWFITFEVFITLYGHFRDFFIFPFNLLAEMVFGVEIPVLVRSYLFLGTIMFGAYNQAHRDICDESLLEFPHDKFFTKWGNRITTTIYGILFFPKYIVFLYKNNYPVKNEYSENVDRYFGIYLRNILIGVILMIVISLIIGEWN